MMSNLLQYICVLIITVVLVGCGEKAAPLPAPYTPKGKPEIPEASQAAEAEIPAVPKPSPAPNPIPSANEKLITNPIVEKAIRQSIKKPEGELTEEDFEKVTILSLFGTKGTDAVLKEVAKLQNLNYLELRETKITDAGLKEFHGED